jgi:hypothetical protein
MKKLFVMAVISSFAAVGTADVILQDFEAGTSSSLIASQWLPDFSGTSVGCDGTDDEAQYSTDQANGGTKSGRLVWDWDGTAAGGNACVRIHPAGNALNNMTLVNHSGEPFFGMAVFGNANNQGDELQIYMGEAASGGSPYAAFTSQTLVTWTGWKVVERNILTDAVVDWVVVNDNLLNPSCTWAGLFIRRSGNPNGYRNVYHIDDILFATNTRLGAGVNNWSVY